PAALELSLQAADRVEQERDRLHRHWRQRRDRAAYEAARAARQYDAGDPDNRLVARTLERQWEERLAGPQRLGGGDAPGPEGQPGRLAEADRERIRARAADMPALWHAAGAGGADRRGIVRQLIERVELTQRSGTERLDVAIRWRGGMVSRHEVARRVHRYEQ